MRVELFSWASGPLQTLALPISSLYLRFTFDHLCRAFTCMQFWSARGKSPLKSVRKQKIMIFSLFFNFLVIFCVLPFIFPKIFHEIFLRFFIVIFVWVYITVENVKLSQPTVTRTWIYQTGSLSVTERFLFELLLPDIYHFLIQGVLKSTLRNQLFCC